MGAAQKQEESIHMQRESLMPDALGCTIYAIIVSHISIKPLKNTCDKLSLLVFWINRYFISPFLVAAVFFLSELCSQISRMGMPEES